MACYITIATGKKVTLGQYVAGVKLAIRNPDREFTHGLTTWWPTTGAAIRAQFREGLHQRISEAVPYIEKAYIPG